MAGLSLRWLHRLLDTFCYRFSLVKSLECISTGIRAGPVRCRTLCLPFTKHPNNHEHVPRPRRSQNPFDFTNNPRTSLPPQNHRLRHCARTPPHLPPTANKAASSFTLHSLTLHNVPSPSLLYPFHTPHRPPPYPTSLTQKKKKWHLSTGPSQPKHTNKPRGRETLTPAGLRLHERLVLMRTTQPQLLLYIFSRCLHRRRRERKRRSLSIITLMLWRCRLRLHPRCGFLL
jgi:hypothetical protein